MPCQQARLSWGFSCVWVGSQRWAHVIMPAVMPNMAPKAPVEDLSLATADAKSAPKGSDKPLSVPRASALSRECVAWYMGIATAKPTLRKEYEKRSSAVGTAHNYSLGDVRMVQGLYSPSGMLCTAIAAASGKPELTEWKDAT